MQNNIKKLHTEEYRDYKIAVEVNFKEALEVGGDDSITINTFAIGDGQSFSIHDRVEYQHGYPDRLKSRMKSKIEASIEEVKNKIDRGIREKQFLETLEFAGKEN